MNFDTEKDKQVKPYICCVVDVQGWAFDSIAQNIIRHLSNKYTIEIVYTGLFPDLSNLYRKLFIGDKNYDLIHFFWHPNLSSLLDSQILFNATHGLSSTEREAFFWNVARAYKTTSVYDHLFLGTDETDIAARRTLALSDAYTVSSSRLNDIYDSLNFMKSPDMVISDGVDLSFFKPSIEQYNSKSINTVLVGWAGNSAWGPNGVDHKGLNTIIKPLIAKLKAENFSVEGRFCDRSIHWEPKETMPEFYNSIDIYICASLTEGTPNPILEAMACGLPIITTDVGIVREIFGPLQSEFIIKDRNSPELIEKLRKLILNPELRKQLSIENLESIKNSSCESKATQWESFFLNTLSSKSKNLESLIREQAMLLGIWSKGHSHSITTINQNQELKKLIEANNELCPELLFLKPLNIIKIFTGFFNSLFDFALFLLIPKLPYFIQSIYRKNQRLPSCYFVFNWWRFIKENSDLIQAGICRGPEAARHWIKFGVNENRILRPQRMIRKRLEKYKCHTTHPDEFNLTIITRMNNHKELSSALKQSLEQQSNRHFRHFVYYCDKPELSYVEEYRESSVLKKNLHLKNYSNYVSDVIYFGKVLSQFGNNWLLFLDEEEILSSPKLVESIMKKDVNPNALILVKKQFPSWQNQRVISDDLELSNSCLTCFLVHSIHLPKLVWDDLPNSNNRLLMRLINEVKYIWADDLIPNVDHTNQLENNKSKYSNQNHH